MASKKQTGPASAKAQPGEMPFEKAMEQLESIVEAMESEKLPLDDLVRKYEEGTRLLKICQSRITAAQKKIELISRGAGSDDLELTTFEPGQEKDAAAPARGETDEIQLL